MQVTEFAELATSDTPNVCHNDGNFLWSYSVLQPNVGTKHLYNSSQLLPQSFPLHTFSSKLFQSYENNICS